MSHKVFYSILLYLFALDNPSCVYIQHHQAAQLAEGMVGDVADVVEGKCHGLQGRELAQCLHWDLPQRVIIQPEVTE